VGGWWGYSNGYRVVVQELIERGQSEDLGEDGRIILKWVLSQYGRGCGLDLLG